MKHLLTANFSFFCLWHNNRKTQDASSLLVYITNVPLLKGKPKEIATTNQKNYEKLCVTIEKPLKFHCGIAKLDQ